MEQASSLWFLEFALKVSLQAAVLALIVLAVSRFARKASAGLRYLLWAAVLIKFFVPPFAHYPSEFAFWKVEAGPKPAAIAQAESSVTPPLADPGVSGTIGPVQVGNPPLVIEPSASVSRNIQTKESSPPRVAIPDLRAVARIIWLMGASFMLGVLFIRWRWQVRMMKTAIPANRRLRAQVADASSRMRMRKAPRVGVSEAAGVPMVVGFIRPMVILPSSIVGACDSKQIEAILLHEFAHVKRMDMVMIWLQQIAQMFFFFHPFLWLAGSEAAKERELACDDLVLSRSGISPAQYARGYLAALKYAQLSPARAVSLGMAEPVDTEKQRMLRIMRYTHQKNPVAWMVVTALVIALGLPTFTGVRAWGEGDNNGAAEARIGSANVADDHPERRKAYRNDKAYEYLQKKDCEAALTAYQDLTKDYPNAPEAARWYRYMMDCYVTLNRMPEALAAIDKSIEISSEASPQTDESAVVDCGVGPQCLSIIVPWLISTNYSKSM
ncbi:MAG: tetratricopeptide repeat protein [Armatimonadetes bacterium]|nr:tetratricopeptide repeat protein [Armatimonadota bacterium]